MEPFEAMFEEAVAAFRGRLTFAVKSMHDVRTPEAFCTAEREVVGLARDLAAHMTQRVLQNLSEDEGVRAWALARVRAIAGKRGIEVRGAGDRETPVRTLGGQVVTVTTAYAVAKPRSEEPLQVRGDQGTGVYPVLDLLGIVGRSTPALRLLVSRTVVEANSVTSARDLLAAGGVDVDHKAALRLTYLATEDALRARRAAVDAVKHGIRGELSGRRVVATVDGGRVLVRRLVAGRPKRGGRKHFVTEWREPKVLTIYVLDEAGRRDRSVPTVIDGTMGDASEVFALLRYHLLRLGAHEASELALVGDGAPWIWARAEELRIGLKLPRERFHEVIDYFHVVERLGELAALQEWTDDERNLWVGQQKRALKTRPIEEVEQAVLALRYADDAARERELDFWSRNRSRLCHAKALQARLPIGSGAVESSVRRVINLRMKGPSIAWTERHAEGVLHLRAYAKSTRWSEVEQTILRNTGWRPTQRRP